MPKLYTKRGDAGKSGLYSGERLPKHDLRFHVLGVLDELQVCIGFIVDLISAETEHTRDTQRILIRISSDIATTQSAESKHDKVRQALLENMKTAIQTLELKIDMYDARLPKLTKFILIGTSIPNSYIHSCRVITRKAERLIVELSQHQEIPISILKYINRLSDYFFVMARYYTHIHGETEIEN